MLRAAIFDLDGLLIDSEPLWQEAEIEVFASVGVRLTRADCARTKGLRVDDTVSYWLDARPGTGAGAEEIQHNLVRRVIELIRERGQPKPGVAHALAFCSGKGLALAVASSSSPAVIHAALARLGIAGRFRVIHSAVDEERGKPDPAVYRTTASRLGVSPAECVALEDSVHGVRSARAAGMKCVAVPDDSTGDPGRDREMNERLGEADLVLPSLLDLNDRTWGRIG